MRCSCATWCTRRRTRKLQRFVYRIAATTAAVLQPSRRASPYKIYLLCRFPSAFCCCCICFCSFNALLKFTLFTAHRFSFSGARIFPTFQHACQHGAGSSLFLLRVLGELKCNEMPDSAPISTYFYLCYAHLLFSNCCCCFI